MQERLQEQKLFLSLRQLTGCEKKVSIVSKNMIRFLGIFSPFMKEYTEMYYLNEEPVILSGEKYEREIGPVPKTPYKEGLEKTINWEVI